MISVGIDVSKEKSTVYILKPYGEIVSRPFEVCHVEKELSELAAMLLRLNDDVRVVMEATGLYHLPVLNYLKEKGLFVAVLNPFEMKEYRCQGLRRVKTDKQDAITISKIIVSFVHKFTTCTLKIFTLIFYRDVVSY